jgi:hypothetical protein
MYEAAAAAANVSIPALPAAGASAVGVFLAVILAIQLWKKSSSRFTPVLATAVGLCCSALIIGWLGTIAEATIFGAGIIGLADLAGALVLWHEVVKKRGFHKMRTPMIALAWGIALAASGGAVGNAAHQTQTTITRSTDNVTNATTGKG